MAKALVSDPLWAAMEPLLPGEPAKPKGGRPRVADRVALSGMILVLRSGIPGEMPPAEIGRSGMTCWRGLRDRQAAGVWARLPRTRLEPERMPTSSMEPGLARRGRHGCEKGGSATGPNPPDRGKAGTKRHVVVDRVGPPLSLSLSGANRHDNLVLAPTLDTVPPVRHGRGAPRCRPARATRSGGAQMPPRQAACRQSLWPPALPHRMPPAPDHASDCLSRRGGQRAVGSVSGVVERTPAWLTGFRRLTIRDERREDIHLAFTTLGRALIRLDQCTRSR
jgi:transposase